MPFNNSEFHENIFGNKRPLRNRREKCSDRILYISPFLDKIRYNRHSL